MCQPPAHLPNHAAESGHRPQLKVLQNSGSRMFMVGVKTLSARDSHRRNFSATHNGWRNLREFLFFQGTVRIKAMSPDLPPNHGLVLICQKKGMWICIYANLNHFIACSRPDKIFQNSWLQTYFATHIITFDIEVKKILFADFLLDAHQADHQP